MKSPKSTLTTLVALAISLSSFGVSALIAQTVTYDFNNQPGSVAAATPSVLDSGYGSTISLVNYTDLTAPAGTSIRWQSHPISLNTGRYLQIGITNENDAFTLTNFTFTPTSFRAAESAQIEVRFSTKAGADFNTDYITVWSSVTRYTAGGTPVSISLTDPAILEKVQGITTGYFRIYTFDPWKTSSGSADPGIWLGVDDIQITAVSSAIPEPSAAAALLGGLAIAGAVAFRRPRVGR